MSSSTPRNEQDTEAMGHAERIEMELARVVRHLAAHAGVRGEVRSYHALPAIALLCGVWMVLDSNDGVLALVRRHPDRASVGVALAFVVSFLAIGVLIAPTEIVPRWRAASVRRRFAPPSPRLDAAERVRRLTILLHSARVALDAARARRIQRAPNDD